MKKTTLFVTAVVIALAGCGGSDSISDRERVQNTVQRYFGAVAGGNGEAACRSLSGQARRSFAAVLAVAPAADCEANVRKVARRSVPLRETEVSQVVVTDNRATARVTSARPPYASSVTLTRANSSWKLVYLPVAIHKFQFPRLHSPGHH